MSKDLFDAVIGVTPPSTVDVAAIVRRRRRVIASRRVGAVVTSVLGGGVLVAAGLTLLGGKPPAPAQGSPVTIMPGAASPTPGATSPSAEQQLGDAVVQAVAVLIPDAHWLPGGQAPVVTVPTDDLDVQNGVLYVANGDLARAKYSGHVMVGVTTSDQELTCKYGVAYTCVVGLTPDGATMVTRSYKPSALPNGMTGPIPVTSREVDIALPSGQTLYVDAFAPKDPTVAAPDTVLTETELVAVADDIARRITALPPTAPSETRSGASVPQSPIPSARR
jgi:hypothetical protein